MTKMQNTDWHKLANFSKPEFICQCGCGNELMDKEFMDTLQQLRTEFGKPIKITSGYRCKKHPVEIKKSAPGTHTMGKAGDIYTPNGEYRYQLIQLASGLFSGIGINGKSGFVHLDTATEADGKNRPNLWTY